jgi:hypothetical protein
VGCCCLGVAESPAYDASGNGGYVASGEDGSSEATVAQAPSNCTGSEIDAGNVAPSEPRPGCSLS